MKHLNGIKYHVASLKDGTPTWVARTHIAIPDRSEPEEWEHHVYDDTIEWRIAEYNMDPNDIDAVVHLIMHEWMLGYYLYKPRGGDITPWSKGHTPESALKHRLKHIDNIIGATEKSLSASHKKVLHKDPIHKHDMFNPLRERGAREDKVHARSLYVSGSLDFHAGRKLRGTSKMNEASDLLMRETGSR